MQHKWNNYTPGIDHSLLTIMNSLSNWYPWDITRRITKWVSWIQVHLENLELNIKQEPLLHDLLRVFKIISKGSGFLNLLGASQETTKYIWGNSGQHFKRDCGSFLGVVIERNYAMNTLNILVYFFVRNVKSV